jgi:hypothetical protein
MLDNFGSEDWNSQNNRTTERLNIDNTIKDEEHREVRCKVARSRK